MKRPRITGIRLGRALGCACGGAGWIVKLDRRAYAPPLRKQCFWLYRARSIASEEATICTGDDLEPARADG